MKAGVIERRLVMKKRKWRQSAWRNGAVSKNNGNHGSIMALMAIIIASGSRKRQNPAAGSNGISHQYQAARHPAQSVSMKIEMSAISNGG